jgi:nitrile hydratase accessory protein
MPLSPTSNAPEAPPFDEPWQAQVYAMVVSLERRGLFGWSEWTDALASEIPPGLEHASFPTWLRALEKLLIARNVVSGAELHELAEEWRAAAEATPHGQAIVLGAGRP